MSHCPNSPPNRNTSESALAANPRGARAVAVTDLRMRPGAEAFLRMRIQDYGPSRSVWRNTKRGIRRETHHIATVWHCSCGNIAEWSANRHGMREREEGCNSAVRSSATPERFLRAHMELGCQDHLEPFPREEGESRFRERTAAYIMTFVLGEEGHRGRGI